MWFDEELLDDLDEELTKENMLKKYIYDVVGELPIMGTSRDDADKKVNAWLQEYKPRYVGEVTFKYSMEIQDGKFTRMEEE